MSYNKYSSVIILLNILKLWLNSVLLLLGGHREMKTASSYFVSTPASQSTSHLAKTQVCVNKKKKKKLKCYKSVTQLSYP